MSSDDGRRVWEIGSVLLYSPGTALLNLLYLQLGEVVQPCYELLPVDKIKTRMSVTVHRQRKSKIPRSLSDSR